MSYFQFKKSSPIELIQQIQSNSKLNQIERETFACGGCNWNEKKSGRGRQPELGVIICVASVDFGFAVSERRPLFVRLATLRLLKITCTQMAQI